MTYDLGKVVKWAIPLVWAALIFEALNLYHTWLYIDLLDRVQTSANYTMSEVDFVDTVGPLVAFPFIGILISAYVASGMWIYRAAHNANQISPSETRITPGWSVGWFFIPVASLWKPYQAMRHTWNTAMDAASARLRGVRARSEALSRGADAEITAARATLAVREAEIA
ncbi:MAG: DUF4328 domain-containing protein, partial [Planktomarina sp.]